MYLFKSTKLFSTISSASKRACRIIDNDKSGTPESVFGTDTSTQLVDALEGIKHRDAPPASDMANFPSRTAKAALNMLLSIGSSSADSLHLWAGTDARCT